MPRGYRAFTQHNPKMPLDESHVLNPIGLAGIALVDILTENSSMS
jgi:hypothetical protein